MRNTNNGGNEFLEGIYFYDVVNGAAVGQHGTIMKYNVITQINNTGNNQEISKDYVLLQNYPDPFNPETKINYGIPRDARRRTQDVKLIVYNSLGKEIATLVNQKQSAGRYSVNWNASGYTSGIYFYKLVVSFSNSIETSGFSMTKKMLLVK